MTLEARNDLFMCKTFPSSLTGVALEWFKNRPCKSISNFETLCIAFLAQYCGNKKQKKAIASLFTIQQIKGKAYKPFSLGSIWNPRACRITTKIAMVQGTCFHSSLVKKTLANMSELNSRAQNYIRLEENEMTMQQRATLVTVKIRPKKHLSTSRAQREPPSIEGRALEKKSQIIEKVTPFKVTLARLYQETKGRNIFQIPPPIRQPME
ncbi:uncharacterized protein LOC132313843 [Cornus florida]|uniref:uncharacterized protein LOC132313843 n=1 Tax=Cornus florida TaxID=4283 RepID=UPI00289B3EC8|nr:uncharacterized protein LOC132313843 [Cornus florida]